MRFTIAILSFLFIVSTVAFAQIAEKNPSLSGNRDSSHSFVYDSISITREQRQDIKYLLTESSIEVVCEDYDLVSLYGVAPELIHLFDQLKSAWPAKTEQKMRDELEGDYGDIYDIKVYNKGKNLSTIRILYEGDYPYLSPGMLDYIHTLGKITQYYNSFLAYHHIFEIRMTPSLEKNYLGLCNGEIGFEEKWESLQKRNPDENPNIECAQMSLIFAQCLINAKRTGTYFDLRHFLESKEISFSKLKYYSSFVKQDEETIQNWIEELMKSNHDSVSEYSAIQDSPCRSDTTDSDIPLEEVEIQPEYPEGDQELYSFINQNFKFPQETLEAGKVSGRFVISFIVEKDGTITDIQVVRSFEEHFDKAMISIFEQMPKWKPGEHLGKIVRTKYTWGISYDYKG